eukprot:SAG11_NODE_1649_length_4511_cov_3.281505_2_plen_162_part_00
MLRQESKPARTVVGQASSDQSNLPNGRAESYRIERNLSNHTVLCNKNAALTVRRRVLNVCRTASQRWTDARGFTHALPQLCWSVFGRACGLCADCLAAHGEKWGKPADEEEGKRSSLNKLEDQSRRSLLLDPRAYAALHSVTPRQQPCKHGRCEAGGRAGW